MQNYKVKPHLSFVPLIIRFDCTVRIRVIFKLACLIMVEIKTSSVNFSKLSNSKKLNSELPFYFV